LRASRWLAENGAPLRLPAGRSRFLLLRDPQEVWRVAVGVPEYCDLDASLRERRGQPAFKELVG
jgi:hypothetical protein